MVAKEIRDATHQEIKDIMSFADSAAGKIRNLAWAADILLMDQLKLDSNNEQLCSALWSFFNVIEEISKGISNDLQRGI